MWNKIKDKSITYNIFKIQSDFYCYYSYVRILLYCFREHVIAAKSLLDYTNLSSPNDYQYNDKIVYLRSLKANTAKEKLSLDIRLKNRWNKKLLFRSIKHYDLMCEKNKSVQVFKLLKTIYCFSFCCQWLCFNFCICFISWCFCRYLNSMRYKNNGDLPCQL